MKSFFLEDTNRNEQDLGHPIDRPRRLEIEVYYPAVKVDAPQYKAHFLFTDNGKIENLWTRSQPGISPNLDEKAPVVIFSHGLNNNHDDYQQMIEELASYGFCVVTVSHPFTNCMSYFTGNSPDTQLYPKGIMENDRAFQERATNSHDIQFVINQIREGQIEGFHDFLAESINPLYRTIFFGIPHTTAKERFDFLKR